MLFLTISLQLVLGLGLLHLYNMVTACAEQGGQKQAAFGPRKASKLSWELVDQVNTSSCS